MPVTYLVNRNIVISPVLGSNVASTAGSNVFSIVSDPQGNVYIGGTYTGNGTTCFLPTALTTGPNTNTANTLPNVSATNSTGGFFAKYNTSGNLVFSLGIATAANVAVNSVCLDQTSSNIYVAFQYQTAASTTLTINTPSLTGGSVAALTIPSSTASGETVPDWGACLLKVSALGAIQWASTINSSVAGASPLNDNVSSVISDQLGNAYLALQYNSGASGPSILNGAGPTGTPSGTTVQLAASSAPTSGALIKYSPTGQAQWASCIIPSAASTVIISPGSPLTVDSTNSVYLGFNYPANSTVSTVTLPKVADNVGGTGGGGTVTLPSSATGASYNGAIVRYASSSGSSSQMLWCASLNNITSGAGTYVTSLAFGAYGSLYACGNVLSTTTTSVWNGQGTGAAPAATGSTISIPSTASTSTSSGYVLKFFSSNGVCQTSSTISPTTASNNSTYTSICVDSSDINVYACGKCSTGASSALNILNPNGTITCTLPGTTTAATSEAFMARFFMGNALASTTFTGANGSTLTQLNSVFIDSGANNVYASGQYNGTLSTIISAATATGPTGTPGLTMPGVSNSTTNPSAVWFKCA
jgi:hypothetical protein